MSEADMALISLAGNSHGELDAMHLGNSSLPITSEISVSSDSNSSNMQAAVYCTIVTTIAYY